MIQYLVGMDFNCRERVVHDFRLSGYESPFRHVSSASSCCLLGLYIDWFHKLRMTLVLILGLNGREFVVLGQGLVWYISPRKEW